MNDQRTNQYEFSIRQGSKWRLILLIVSFLFAPLFIVAQTIEGKVIDADLKEGLPGATVKVVGTQNGVITDLDGSFQLNVPEGASIEVSFVGFVTQIIEVGTQTNFTISLESDSELLEEVVVIGYGEQRKKVATASISKVNSKDLEGFGVPNVGRALQGQVSGVIFKNTSGQAGSAPQILIRGVGTNGNSNPLVIVDGLITDLGILSSLNPDDVESVNILKDGASTAIYGTRAANGVILITTKRAKEGQGVLTYSSNIGFQSAWAVPETLNREQYTELLTEKYENSGLTVPDAIQSGNSSPFNSNWMDAIFGTSKISNHQLTVAKGTQASRFRASFSFSDQEGLIAPEKSNYERITARINADQTINEYISTGQNIFYTQTKGSTIPENNEFGTPIADALVYDPLTPIFDSSSQFGFGQSELVQKEYVNPLSRIFISNNEYTNRLLNGNAFISIKPIENLIVKTDIAITASNNASSGFAPAYELTPAFENEINDIFAFREEFTRWKWENTINYKTNFGKHKVDLLAGIAAQEDSYFNLGGSSSGIQPEVEFDPSFRYLDGAIDTLDRTNGTKGIRSAIYSQFARGIYSFDDKYLMTLIIRRDGSTKFGPNNRYGIFPSISAGWVVSSEDFWNLSLVNFLKARVSYGENGSDKIGDNLFRSTIQSAVYSYQFGEPNSQFIYQGSTTPNLANPDVKWERSRQFDVGFELGLLDDRVSVEFDYYKKITDDLLFFDPAAPLLIGTNPPISNLGEFVNSGIELDINYSQQVGEFTLNGGVNITTLKNEVTKLNGENPFVDLYSWPVRNVPITRMQVGEPVGFFRGYETDGIFRSQRDVFAHINADGLPLQPNAEPGDLRFVDVNGDGEITSDDITKIGKPWADLTVGFKLGTSYKNFDFSALFFASFGSELYRTYERQDVANNNYQTEWLDRYSESNPNGSYPRLSFSGENTRPSDFYIESGNFLRLKNIQLSYTIPSTITEKAKITKAKFFIAADNLLTVTGYTGFDPEIGGGIGVTGVDRGFYPISRTITGGLSISF